MPSSVIHFIMSDNSIRHGWFFPGDGYSKKEGNAVMTTGLGAGEELSQVS